MTDHLHGGALLRRVLAEHRRVVIALAVLLVVSIAVYAAAVYPLAQRVANIQQRDRAAEQGLADARREYDAARNALTGKERAGVELATFYRDILPADLAGARRLTYLRLEQLARESGLKLRSSNYDVDTPRNSTLRRLQIKVELEGSYDSIRTFIYQLDAAPEFVVIDDVSLSKGGLEGDALQLSMRLSTYFRSTEP